MTNRTHVRVAAELGLALTVLLPWMPNAAAQARTASGPVTATLYADGSVECGGADDLSTPVGTATLRPVEHGVEFHVALTGAAADWDYYVELSQGGVCQQVQRFHGLVTDSNGNGWLKGVYAATPGTHEVLVVIVSDPPSAVPPDPRHRELAMAEPTALTVDGDVGSTMTLSFDGAPSSLPWSEQGFTFHDGGNGTTVEGGSLRVTSYGGIWWITLAALSRDDGRPFDALSLKVLEVYLQDPANDYVWVESSLGGYATVHGPGTLTLSGPEWRGITYLWIIAGGSGDGGGPEASFLTDDFTVRVPTGETYCSSTPNSTGAAATIHASGSSNVAANDLVLRADGVPNEPFVFFHAAGRIQAPFGNGLRCAGGDIVRLPAGLATGNTATTVLDLPSAHITAPGPRHFQCWFRDTAAGGASFDTSDGLTITFSP